MHRLGCGKVAADLADDARLGGGQRERKTVDETVDEACSRPSLSHVSDPSRTCQRGTLSHREGNLNPQQLIECETAARRSDCLDRIGPMDSPKSFGPPNKTKLVTQRSGKWVRELAGAFQSLVDICGEFDRRDP